VYPAQENVTTDAGLNGHHHCWSFSVSALPSRPFKSIVGTLEVSSLAFSVVILHRGVS